MVEKRGWTLDPDHGGLLCRWAARFIYPYRSYSGDVGTLFSATASGTMAAKGSPKIRVRNRSLFASKNSEIEEVSNAKGSRCYR